MHTGGDADVETLLQRLEPAQGQPQTGIRLASRNCLQQLIGRTAEVDEFDIDIVLGKDAAFFCDRCCDRAGRVRIPGELELTWRALQLFPVCSGAADTRLAGKIRRRCQRARRSEDPEWGCGSESAGNGKDRARLASPRAGRSSSSC